MPLFQAAYGTSQPDGTVNAGRQAIVTAILSAGSFTGALVGVPIADYAGRRGASVSFHVENPEKGSKLADTLLRTVFVAAILFIIGVVVQIGPDAVYGAFLAGRFIAGAAVGALSALVPLYQGESRLLSPKNCLNARADRYLFSLTQIAPWRFYQPVPAHDYDR
jgi:MFS family permease